MLVLKHVCPVHLFKDPRERILPVLTDTTVCKHTHGRVTKRQQWWFREPGVRKVLSSIFNPPEKVTNCPSIISVGTKTRVPSSGSTQLLQLANQLCSLRASKNKIKNLPLPQTPQIFSFFFFLSFHQVAREEGEN